MQLKNKHYQTMGVLNITPDSFSDGGYYLDDEKVRDQLNYLLSWCDIIDIGAESTAPFNKKIDADLELERHKSTFEKLKPYLLSNELFTVERKKLSLSIDTYKPDVFREVYSLYSSLGFEIEFYWNDVSGQLDHLALELLKEIPDVHYIFCHNLAPSRDRCQEHMNYQLDGEDIFDEVISFFDRGLKTIENYGLANPITLDLCFGFSKSRSQNQKLLTRLSDFFSHFKMYNHLIGISRKSFLRFDGTTDAKSLKNKHHLDALQGLILSKLNLNNDKVIYRSHTLFPFKLWDEMDCIFTTS